MNRILPQLTHTTSLEDQTRILHHILAHPPTRKRSQDMPVCHNQHVARRTLIFRLPDDGHVEAFSDISYDRVEAVCDLLRRPL